MPDKHCVVKDVPFYKEARIVDVKKMTDRLAQKEKKRQEGTLRQALGGSRLTTNSTTCLHSKKKSVPRPAKKALDLSLPLSFLSSYSPSVEDS